MGLTKSTNPVLSEDIFEKQVEKASGYGQMTVKGAATKTLLLLLMTTVTASITWKLFNVENTMVFPLMIGGAIGAFIFALITSFKPEKSAIFGSLYAICEGLALGAVSAAYNYETYGLVFQAVLLTFVVTAIMAFCYRMGILQATAKFTKVLFFATAAVGVFYLLSIVLSFFNIELSVFRLGLLGIVIQFVIVAVAALNLILDFDVIESGVREGAPEYMEWYGAFSLMVTLVWLYLEILRLLSILNRRN